MWTLARWKSERRVDHVKIGPFNPRYRGRPDLDLKALDEPVGRYERANNFQDRISALGEIIAKTAGYTAADHAQNTYAPVNDLAQEAGVELQQKLEGTSIPYNAMSEALKGSPGELPPMKVVLKTYALCVVGAEAGPIPDLDDLIDEHVEQANAVFNQNGASLTILRGTPRAEVISCIKKEDGDTADNSFLNASSLPGYFKKGLFGDLGRANLARYFNATPALFKNSVEVVYVPEFDQDDVQGVTTRPSTKDVKVKPQRPFVAINRTMKSGTTYPSTLVHELVHALIDNGDHSSDEDNLMAEGSKRNGKNALTFGQICALRSNPTASAD